MTLRSVAVTSRIPAVWASSGDGATAGNSDATTKKARRMRMSALLSGGGGKAIEAGRESQLAKHRREALVVDGRICVDPIALGIHVQLQDPRHIPALQQDLALRHEIRQDTQFHFV